MLSRGYGISRPDISETIGVLIKAANVIVNLPAAEAGLARLTAGGDFADGVVAFEGQRLGAIKCLSFDWQAVKLTKAQGLSAEVLESA